MPHQILYSVHYSFKYSLNILAIEIFLFYSGTVVLTNIFGVKEPSLRIGTRERGFSNGNKGEKRVKPNWEIRGGEAYRGGSY